MTEAGNRKGRSAGDRSIVSAANAKNGKSQESSFFPAGSEEFQETASYGKGCAFL